MDSFIKNIQKKLFNYTQQLRYNLDNLPFKEMMDNLDIAEIQQKMDATIEKKIKMKLEN